jgi:putative endonuclease
MPQMMGQSVMALMPKCNWVCYLLECADGTIYCGVTNDLEKRLAAHNAGAGAKYTRGRTPVKLVHSEVCADKQSALQREYQVKRMARADKLSLCRVTQLAEKT